MINAIPFLGWFISAVASVSLAIPFWICWTACGIGKAYFDFLPAKYQSIPFWNCVGIFVVVSVLKAVFVPRFVSVSSSSSSGSGKKEAK